MTREANTRGPIDDRVLLSLDDVVVGRIAEAAGRRGVEFEQLLLELILAASSRIDELLNPPS